MMFDEFAATAEYLERTSVAFAIEEYFPLISEEEWDRKFEEEDGPNALSQRYPYVTVVVPSL